MSSYSHEKQILSFQAFQLVHHTSSYNFLGGASRFTSPSVSYERQTREALMRPSENAKTAAKFRNISALKRARGYLGKPKAADRRADPEPEAP